MAVVFDLDGNGGGGAPAGPDPRSAPPRHHLSPRTRRQALGMLAIFLVAVVIAGVIMAYDQVFSPGVSATVVTPQAGLLMTTGADVTLNGVTVGRVTSVTTAGGDQARLGISLFPGQVTYIPSNVQASIQAPTVFGPKFLNLTIPAKPSIQTIQAGEVIESSQSPTEIDTVFASLVSVLNSVQPAKLSATLGAISTALQGQGPEIASFVKELNVYLKEFDPSLPALGTDLSTAPTVANTYAAAAPDLIKSLDNLKVTSGTLTSNQAQFDAFLVDLSGFSGNAQNFLSANGQDLTSTLASLLPTSQLLDEYSPEYQCLFASINGVNKIDKTNDIVLNTALVPGSNTYKNPTNLPVVGADSGPSCYGGPLTQQSQASYERQTFDDGTQDFFSNDAATTVNIQSLAQQLFGSSGASTAESAATNKKGQ
ncbi:MAG TPA: MCE family protein [Trebonia sp.]|jgi:phospholipid/cholesterol/gamma-HCH transport system substrate-binding protein